MTRTASAIAGVTPVESQTGRDGEPDGRSDRQREQRSVRDVPPGPDCPSPLRDRSGPPPRPPRTPPPGRFRARSCRGRIGGTPRSSFAEGQDRGDAQACHEDRPDEDAAPGPGSAEANRSEQERDAGAEPQEHLEGLSRRDRDAGYRGQGRGQGSQNFVRFVVNFKVHGGNSTQDFLRERKELEDAQQRRGPQGSRGGP